MSKEREAMIKAKAQSCDRRPKDGDPSFNVLGVVESESKYQDGMRIAFDRLQTFALDAENKLQTFARESESKMQTWMRDAESKRLDQLSAQKQASDTQIANILADGVKDKSNLVSTQLVQIQSTFDTRVAKLEEFRLLSTGRSSVADPALATTLETLGRNISGMQASFTKTMNDFSEKHSGTMDKMALSILALQDTGRIGSGKDAGRSEVIAWLVAAVMLVASIATPIITFVITKSH
jgi:hypothetical protein